MGVLPTSADELIAAGGGRAITPRRLRGKKLEEFNKIREAYKSGQLDSFAKETLACHTKRICGLTCSVRTIEKALDGDE